MKKRRAAAPVHVGRYNLGTHDVDLYLDPRETGGAFSWMDGKWVRPKITVGGNYAAWRQVLAVALHEAAEMTFSLMGLRWAPDLDFAAASDGFRFQMDHAQFSEAMARVGHFLTDATPDLCAAYEKHRGKR